MRGNLTSATILALAALSPGFAHAQASNLRTNITIVLPEEPPTLDACSIVTVGPSRVLGGNVVEGLTERTPGTTEAKPLLATSWKQTSPTTWEFTLRNGVRFHDGSPFNAETAAISVNRTFTPSLRCSVMTLAFGVLKVKAEAVGEKSLKLTTNQPDPLLPFRSSFLGMSGPKTQMDRQTESPVGTGPYRFVRWQRGTSITLERNDNYWGQKPDLLKATYLFRGDDTVRAGMIQTGEADVSIALSPEHAKTKGAQVFPIPVAVALRMDTSVPPFTDKRVRQAVDHAIDRKGLIDAVWSGAGRVGTQVITPEVAGYNPNIKPTPYDPALAKKLIAAAKADGVPVDKPIRLLNRLDLYPHADLFAAALSEQLNAIGLNTQPQNMEAAAWIERLLNPARPPASDIVIDPHQNALGDASQSVNARFHSSQKRNRIPQEYQPKVDAMIAEAGAAVGEERIKLFQRLFAFLSEEVIQDANLAYLESTIMLGPKVRYKPNAQSHTLIRLSQIQIEK